MRRAVSIGTVTFDKVQYYLNEFDSQGVSAESDRTIDGGAIVYEQNNLASAMDVTLGSGDNYPISETNLKELQTLCDDSLGKTFTVTFNDASTIDVRFKHESTPLESSGLWEGSCLYYITLNLARV